MFGQAVYAIDIICRGNEAVKHHNKCDDILSSICKINCDLCASLTCPNVAISACQTLV